MATERKSVVRDWEGVTETYCLIGTEFQLGMIKKRKLLKMESGKGCTTLNLLNVTILYP